MNGIPRIPDPRNEPVTSFAPGTPERTRLKSALSQMAETVTEIPLVIGGESLTTPATRDITMPHNHQKVVGKGHLGSGVQIEKSISAAEDARNDWARLPFEERATVFLRAADLLAGPWRDRINVATMLGQSKTVHQAEIDAACELIDFWRFNVHFADQLMREQPLSPPGMWNRLEMRPLDGFVYAITPFNFTSIAGNLPTAPALMGNTVVWKPARTQMLAAHFTMQLLEAAGLPPGVINMISGDSSTISDIVLNSPYLGGIHFTGSTAVFQQLWGTVGTNIASYRQYPRLVGETGGKDFIFAHQSTNVDALACAIVRGGFEFQGQKCSAPSRVYVPKSVWTKLKEPLIAQIRSIKVGDIGDCTNFMGAVIDEAAFNSITSYIDLANGDGSCTVHAGGTYSNSHGWFVQPTLVETTDPKHRLMREEIFGPVVTLFVYDDDKLDATLELCDTASPYGLTGAVFAEDRFAINKISARLSGTAGNFYVNDKPTGAVVGQQPFGGSRASGTNDKAGSPWNLMRWTSPRAIKETFVPATDYKYPFMDEA